MYISTLYKVVALDVCMDVCMDAWMYGCCPQISRKLLKLKNSNAIGKEISAKKSLPFTIYYNLVSGGRINRFV